MERRLFFAAIFLGMTCLLPSCDIFETCGKCVMVTVKPDGTETRTAPVALCGPDLDEKRNFVPEVVDGNTIYWECD